MGLPDTGFAPGKTQFLPKQPIDLAYLKYDDVQINIPGLDIKTDIVGVPLQNGQWDVKWLRNDIGWLEGSTFPGKNGNAVLTGHVFNANGLQGPFVNLKNLLWGDKVIITAFDEQYIYEVREVKQWVNKDEIQILSHEDTPYLTLITCQGYDPEKDHYAWRTVVRAVLVETRTQ
jgi:LPXTG-site transpeptidase (sortase) family protein